MRCVALSSDLCDNQTSDESNDMQRAMNESLRDAPFADIPMDDLQRAQLMSMHEFEQKVGLDLLSQLVYSRLCG
jgi:hypothetical protein